VGVDSDEEMCVKESFLGFAEASSTTGEELETTIMIKLREYGIFCMVGDRYLAFGGLFCK
jgi:hypothetical protein